MYALSPVFIQNWMVSAYGRKLMKQRYGQDYREAFLHYTSKDYSAAAAEHASQAEQLVNFLRFARDNSRFYSRLYSSINIDKVQAVGDLEILPIVEKEAFRANILDVYTIPAKDGIELFTGGTTGKSLKVVYTVKDFQTRMAYLDAFKVRCGVDPFRSSKATFSGRSMATGVWQRGSKIFWRDNRPYNQRLYSTFDLTDSNIRYYVEDLNKFRPMVVNGFVSAIHQIARYILDAGVRLSFTPAAIFTTSETLLPHHREAIEQAFGARVFNQYASAEGATFITECANGNLHYNIDTGVIESVDLGLGPEMLITSFTTHGTPLIRYRIGDGILMGHGRCGCGSSHPVVERIEGRSVDYLTSPEKGRVSLSHLADVIKGLPNCVKEMQFVQEDTDRVLVKLVVDEELYSNAADEKILSAMRYRFGDKMKVELSRVKSIPREPSGKFSLIKNSVGRARPAGKND
jgi:phenylacetate-CoA ligase